MDFKTLLFLICVFASVVVVYSHSNSCYQCEDCGDPFDVSVSKNETCDPLLIRKNETDYKTSDATCLKIVTKTGTVRRCKKRVEPAFFGNATENGIKIFNVLECPNDNCNSSVKYLSGIFKLSIIFFIMLIIN